MVGELVAKISNKSDAGAQQALELWAFADQTLNLLLISQTAEQTLEYSFPCTVPMLAAVLDEQPLHMRVEEREFRLTRQGSVVWAQVDGAYRTWAQSIDVRTYSEAVDQAALVVGG